MTGRLKDKLSRRIGNTRSESELIRLAFRTPVKMSGARVEVGIRTVKCC